MIRALIMLFLSAVPAAALDLAHCDRTTHISHGGERGHRDIGAGRVMYQEWWAQEGIFVDVVVADCATGKALTTRLVEERIKDRPPFDRLEKGLRLLDQHLTISPALFHLDWLARALDGTGRDTEIAMLRAEPCACAALYPEVRGAWPAFEGLK